MTAAALRARCRRVSQNNVAKAFAAPAQITPGTPPAILIFGVWGVWGSPPGLAPQARNFWAFALLLITKHRAAYCNAPYTHAHCTSKIRARFSSVAFATYLRSVGAAPARSLRGRHWGVPTNGCDHGPPQARLLGVCACFVVKKGRAFCIECIALCSLDAPETRNLSWHGRVPNEAARFALCSP